MKIAIAVNADYLTVSFNSICGRISPFTRQQTYFYLSSIQQPIQLWVIAFRFMPLAIARF